MKTPLKFLCSILIILLCYVILLTYSYTILLHSTRTFHSDILFPSLLKKCAFFNVLNSLFFNVFLLQLIFKAHVEDLCLEKVVLRNFRLFLKFLDTTSCNFSKEKLLHILLKHFTR